MHNKIVLKPISITLYNNRFKTAKLQLLTSQYSMSKHACTLHIHFRRKTDLIHIKAIYLNFFNIFRTRDHTV